jgi:hypothetical protein
LGESELPIDFRIGDAGAPEFEDGSFDASRTERMLMHVTDEQRASSEMVRVTRRGGRVAAFDCDWDMHIVDSLHKDTTRTVVRSFSDGLQHGWIGRQLPRLFREHDLTDVTVLPYTLFLTLEFYELLLGGHLGRVQDQGLLTARRGRAVVDRSTHQSRTRRVSRGAYRVHRGRHEALNAKPAATSPGRSAVIVPGLGDVRAGDTRSRPPASVVLAASAQGRGI